MTKLVRKYTYAEANNYIKGELSSLTWQYQYHTEQYFKECKNNTSWRGRPSYMMKCHQNALELLNKKQQKLDKLRDQIAMSRDTEFYLALCGE